MHVYRPSPYVPRHLRKKGRPSDDIAKKRAFRRAAQWSKRFIHQSADQLAKPALAADYAEWSAAASRGVLRRSTGKGAA